MKLRIHHLASLLLFLKNLPSMLLDIRKSRLVKKSKKETLFVFGSGYSINAISAAEWRRIRRVGDTLGFNAFYRCKKVAIDYHIIRETGYEHYGEESIPFILDAIEENKQYSKTTILLCMHPFSRDTNILYAKYGERVKERVLYFNRMLNLTYAPPSATRYNVPHLGATLFDAVSLGYGLGYKRIILVGVDLYDTRYFWLKRNETKPQERTRRRTYKDVHQTAKPVLEGMRRWSDYLSDRGVELYTYNPKSLLTEFLPVYHFPKDASRKHYK